MNIKKLNRYGILGGFVLVFLASLHFSRSYQAGEPKWFYLVMACGMSIILYNTLFVKPPKRKPKQRK